MPLTVTPVSGAALADVIPDLARLRIRVFRDFPYLYQGTQAYEETYLRTLAQAPDALVVVARDGGQVVGASTALPLIHETPEVRAPFHAPEFDPARVLYLGESVLLPDYRGQGVGHAFFDAREAHAARLGLDVTAFCAVQRPPDHPRRPAGYRPLDAFWHSRGYVERPDLTTVMHWPDLDETHDTPKPMRFWVRAAAP